MENNNKVVTQKKIYIILSTKTEKKQKKNLKQTKILILKHTKKTETAFMHFYITID